MYVENGFKNRQGVFGKDCQDNKVVTLFRNETAAERCIVYLLDLYFSKFPKPVAELDFFYLEPLPLKPEMVESAKAWFASVPIGKNVLAKFVELMCIDAGIAKKTNHSLCVTGASVMFSSGVPEKLIKGVTGHRS